MSTSNQSSPLRVVIFSVLPLAYSIIRQWAKQGGHQLVLVVTTPGPSTRPTPSYQQIVNSSAPDFDVLVTTRPRKVPLPLIRSLAPDLVVSFSFPYRISPEICAIPRYGAVNLHPTVLPAYRGPNPMRAIYEGHSVIGATLHWTTEEYDTGNILAQHSAPLPANTTPESIMSVWLPLIFGTFAKGVARAVAGELGTPQDHSQASYAGAFSEEEHWLSAQDTRQAIQRKTTALSLFSAAAKLRLGEDVYLVARIDPLDETSTTAPGTVVEQTEQGFVLQVADGLVRASATLI